MPLIRVELPCPDSDAEDVGPTAYDEELDERYHAQLATPDRMVWALGPNMGLPGSVVVGDRTYEVRVFDPADERKWDELLGAHSPDGTLWSRRNQRPEDERETLLHEILHAIDSIAATNAGEEVVKAWAPILLGVLRRNPELTSILLAEQDAPSP